MTEALFNRELQKNHDHNAWWNTLDACFWQVAFACSIPGVIIVAFLKHYTNSQMILNLPIFITSFAFTVFPFLMSFFSGRMRRKKTAVIFLGSVQRLIWILVVLSIVCFSKDTRMILIAFFTGYAFYSIFDGCVYLFWQELLGRAILPEKMTVAMGTRESVSRFIGFLSGFLATFLLSAYVFPQNFIALFLVTFFGNLGSIFCHVMIKEAPYEKVINEHPSSHIKNMLLLPAKDQTFKWYAIFSIFASGHFFIGGLYTAVGIDRFHHIVNPDLLAGIISIVTLFSGSIFSFIMGRYCQKAGKYRCFLLIMISMIIAPLWVAVWHNLYGYLFTFILDGLATALFIVDFATVLDFGARERKHEYIAFISIIKVIPVVIFTNLGGYLTDRFSAETTLIMSAGLCLIGLLILIWKLRPMWNQTDGGMNGYGCHDGNQESAKYQEI